MLVKEIMNRNVITAPPETSVREAARIMSDNRVGSIVVTRNGKAVGMLTDRDVLSRFAEGGSVDFDRLPIGDIMAGYVYTIGPGSSVEAAEKMMLDNNVKKLPVVDGDRLVGIVTSTDIAVFKSAVMDSVGKLLSKSLKSRSQGI